MTELGVLQPGRNRRNLREVQRRRIRRRRRIAGFVVLLVLVLLALLVAMVTNVSGRHRVARPRPRPGGAAVAVRRPATPRRGYELKAAPPGERVTASFKNQNLTSGLLFDVRTGNVLWAKDPNAVLPIASLTKMMTALVVIGHARPQDQVMITRQAIHFTGSGVGMLPLGKRVPLSALLYGLLLPSGNDAAIALAQHVGGTQSRFIAMMNATGRAMGLRCTRFSTVSGVIDAGNHSCATDLALLAHAVLEQPLLGRIVGSRNAIVPFPIKGGKLYLSNNNPLLLMRYPGTDGVKTGYTAAAGQCLVAAAKRGRRWYAVVLLHSENTWGQAEELLNRAFALRIPPPTAR